MDSLKEVSSFFHDVSPKILKLVAQSYKRQHIIKQKSNIYDIDFVTEADVEVENIIVGEIKNRFLHKELLSLLNY